MECTRQLEEEKEREKKAQLKLSEQLIFIKGLDGSREADCVAAAAAAATAAAVGATTSIR